jgi:aquaporin Z
VFVGGQAITQLWLFWVAPIAGAVLAGLVHRFVIEERAETREAYG